MSTSSTDLPALLGRALRAIRKQTTRTQDGWAARTGMAQSYMSAVERGESGWDSLKNIATAIERAGADPLDLLRIAAAEVGLPEDLREVVELWPSAPADVRSALLTLLRTRSANSRAATP